MSDLTVDGCLRLAPLAGATVVAGGGATARPVRWLSVIEWPAQGFVARDELVLTTGLGCDESRLATFVGDLAESGAAAVCLAIGDGAPFTRAPGGARTAAEVRAMPLIEIPWAVRFAEILRAVADRVYARDHLPAGFTEALLHRDGLHAIAATLERMIARPVLVLDAALAVVAGGPLGEPRAAGLDLTGLDEETGDEPRHVAAGVLAPALAQGATVGHVLVLDDDGTPAPDAVEQAVVAVAIEMLSRRAAAAAESSARGDFLWELASGALASPREVAAKAALLGYTADRRYRVAVAEGEGPLDGVVTQLRRQGSGVLASRRGARVLALVPESAPPALAPAALLGRLDVSGPSWGIASGAYLLAELADAVRAAERALRVGRALHGPGGVGDADTLGAFLLLDALASDDAAQARAAALLAPLECYDRGGRRGLMQTLQVFLEENGNSTAAARRLFLNRHSLRYRLRKIEALVCCDLACHDDRFLLDLSLRLRRMAAF